MSRCWSVRPVSAVRSTLLWAAREIGADAETQAALGESREERARRLGDKADAVVAAMSAAAHPELTSLLLGHVGGESVWHDAGPPMPYWSERHIRLGSALQVPRLMVGFQRRQDRRLWVS
jgi:hypothetical protein